MCMGGTPKAPAPPPPPPLPPEAPKQLDAEVQLARDDEKANARRAAGRSSAIKTDSDLAGTDPNAAKRTLA